MIHATRGTRGLPWYPQTMLRTSRIAPLIAVFTLGFAALAQTQNLPQGVKMVTSAEGITEYSLTNGLRVLLFPDNSQPKVTVNITYMVGSRFEGYGETGMAHLLEHLNFIQTTTRSDVKKEIVEHA